jgi:hypothetical protein
MCCFWLTDAQVFDEIFTHSCSTALGRVVQQRRVVVAGFGLSQLGFGVARRQHEQAYFGDYLRIVLAWVFYFLFE